jgi:hypothetical protein
VEERKQAWLRLYAEINPKGASAFDESSGRNVVRGFGGDG